MNGVQKKFLMKIVDIYIERAKKGQDTYWSKYVDTFTFVDINEETGASVLVCVDVDKYNTDKAFIYFINSMIDDGLLSNKPVLSERSAIYEFTDILKENIEKFYNKTFTLDDLINVEVIIDEFCKKIKAINLKFITKEVAILKKNESTMQLIQRYYTTDDYVTTESEDILVIIKK